MRSRIMSPNTLIIFALAAVPILAVLHPPVNSSLNDTSDVWLHCWQTQTGLDDIESFSQNMGTCLKHRMYLSLAENVDKKCVDIGDGVTFLAEDENIISPRDLFPQGEEPSSFRGLAEAYSGFLSRRGMRWDLSHLYPGLAMKVGPTFNGNGFLEFVMDRKFDYFDGARLGPGQHFIRRALLPRLLGFRMNLLHLLPLFFGILVYVAKNAFIFSKLTLIVSTLLALKSLFVLQHLRPPVHHDYTDTSVGASETINVIGGPRPQPHSLRPEVLFQMFSSSLPPFRGVNDKPFYDNDKPQGPEELRFRGNRNFSWEK